MEKWSVSQRKAVLKSEPLISLLLSVAHRNSGKSCQTEPGELGNFPPSAGAPAT